MTSWPHINESSKKTTAKICLIHGGEVGAVDEEIVWQGCQEIGKESSVFGRREEERERERKGVRERKCHEYAVVELSKKKEIIRIRDRINHASHIDHSMSSEPTVFEAFQGTRNKGRTKDDFQTAL